MWLPRSGIAVAHAAEADGETSRPVWPSLTNFMRTMLQPGPTDAPAGARDDWSPCLSARLRSWSSTATRSELGVGQVLGALARQGRRRRTAAALEGDDGAPVGEVELDPAVPDRRTATTASSPRAELCPRVVLGRLLDERQRRSPRSWRGRGDGVEAAEDPGRVPPHRDSARSRGSRAARGGCRRSGHRRCASTPTREEPKVPVVEVADERAAVRRGSTCSWRPLFVHTRTYRSSSRAQPASGP